MVAKKHYANIMTFTSLALGICTILLSLRGYSLYFPAFLIILAGVLDRFDGIIARRFNSVSAFGEQIDSFNDIISFGIAPMIMFCQYAEPSHDIVAIVLVTIYLFASVFRLARFHVFEIDGYYIGLPITVAALLFVLFLMIYIIFNLTFITILFMIIILSVLMIMPYKLKKR